MNTLQHISLLQVLSGIMSGPHKGFLRLLLLIGNQVFFWMNIISHLNSGLCHGESESVQQMVEVKQRFLSKQIWVCQFFELGLVADRFALNSSLSIHTFKNPEGKKKEKGLIKPKQETYVDNKMNFENLGCLKFVVLICILSKIHGRH